MQSRLPIRLILVCGGRIDGISRELRRFAATDIGNGEVVVGSTNRNGVVMIGNIWDRGVMISSIGNEGAMVGSIVGNGGVVVQRGWGL